MTIHDPDLDLAADATDDPSSDSSTSSASAPADAADRVRDAENALATFYERVVQVETLLADETVRAERAEHKLDLAELQLVKQNEALAVAARVAESEEHFRLRTAELDQELRNAHEEIQALHNSRTMRAVAFPRRVYAKLRSLVR